MATEHTPTPWLGEVTGYLTTTVPDGENEWKYEYIAIFAMRGLPMEQNEANAAFALRAVNSHDDLVEAAKAARQHIFGDLGNGHPILMQLDAALSKAKGDA